MLRKKEKFLRFVSFIFPTLIFCMSCAQPGNQIVNAESQNKARVEPSSISSDIRQWNPGIFLGIETGKTSEKEVRALFKEPWSTGPNVETVFEEGETLIQFRDVDSSTALLDVVVGKSGIVQAMAVYPAKRQTRDEIIEKYGEQYFEIDSSSSKCVGNNQQPGPSRIKLEYPIALVYPNRGMYVAINNDGSTGHIGFGVKCGKNN